MTQIQIDSTATKTKRSKTRAKRQPTPLNVQERLFAKWKGKISLAFSEIDISNPEHIALLNFQGMPFGTIEKIFGVPHSTAYEHAKKVTGSKTRYFSLMNVVSREYLQNNRISERDKEKIRNWVNRNAGALIETEGTFYTQMQEKTLQKWEGCEFDLELFGGDIGEENDKTEYN